MDVKRKRVKAYVDALSELILSQEPSREKATELIKSHLDHAGIEPFRGASKPDDIYEKELISLYIIGTRGLGISDDFKEVFDTVFPTERKYEEILKMINSDLPDSEVREAIKEIIPDISESDIAKILRFALTLYYLDFEPYEYMIKTIKRLAEILPEHEDTIRRFTKFFVAVKLAEEVANGAIRNRVEKEIRKQVISLETGISKSTPSDNYVAKVAAVTHNIPERTLRNIFGNSGNKRNRVSESSKVKL